jgi:Ras-related GTP-binding protein A/B
MFINEWQTTHFFPLFLIGFSQKDMQYYRSCLDAMQQNSKDAQIFCLIHKMDLVPEEQRDQVFKKRESELVQLSQPFKIVCFRTSIWDETLYKVILRRV